MANSLATSCNWRHRVAPTRSCLRHSRRPFSQHRAFKSSNRLYLKNHCSPALQFWHASGSQASSKHMMLMQAQPSSAIAAIGSNGSVATSYICTAITASTIDAFIAEINEAESAGADIVELRLDYLSDFDTERDLLNLMRACRVPFIVTYRPKWEGGNYEGPEAERLATLKYAALQGAPYVDVEFKAAALFFASRGEVPVSTKIILSSHNFQMTPEASELRHLAAQMHQAGADIVKIATMANDITDSAKVLSLLKNPVVPTIALAMGEKGQLTRLLAAKFGGYLTFATTSPNKASAPGQPSISLLRTLFSYSRQEPATRIFGIIGNPVSHSRSPLIHNTAFQHVGFDGVYVPLLVDDLPHFLQAFEGVFDGFSVTIPHKEAALHAAKDVDAVAKQIGAVNTLIRQPDNSYKGYNTDCSAAITAIERKLSGAAAATAFDATNSPLKGKTFVVIGAGGAGRALAFGAISRGANIVVTNRNFERAEQLVTALAPVAAASGVYASAASWQALQDGQVSGDVLANSTSVGMHPKDDRSPVPASVLPRFRLVFDAVYTPLQTRLLTEAQEAGCDIVDGLQMFVGQAVDQFSLFTGGVAAPVELMRQVVLDSMMGAKK